MSNNVPWVHQITVGDAKKDTILVCKNCDLSYNERDCAKNIENNEGCLQCGKNDFEKKTLLSKTH